MAKSAAEAEKKWQSLAILLPVYHVHDDLTGGMAAHALGPALVRPA
jgi:hypothetical protein